MSYFAAIWVKNRQIFTRPLPFSLYLSAISHCFRLISICINLQSQSDQLLGELLGLLGVLSKFDAIQHTYVYIQFLSNFAVKSGGMLHHRMLIT